MLCPVRHGWILLLLVACRDNSRLSDQTPVVLPRAADATALDGTSGFGRNPHEVLDAAIDAPPDAAELDAGAAKLEGVVVTVDGVPYAMPYGLAYPNYDELRIKLFADPFTCDQRLVNDPPTAISAAFSVPGGPGGTFFAGQPAAIELYVHAAAVKVPVPGDKTRFSYYPASFTPTATLRLERGSRKAKAHIRGTLEAEEGHVHGVVAISGTFDVELCDTLPRPETVLASSAPSGPLGGTHGKKAVVARTIHAIVGRAPANRWEATAGGPAGTLLHIKQLVIYDRANVACPANGDYASDATPLAEVKPVGGTHEKHPLLGTKQPTQVTFFGAKGPNTGDYDGIWPAWTQIDRPLSFEANAKLRGSLWSQAPEYAKKQGRLGGRFTAIVCW